MPEPPITVARAIACPHEVTPRGEVGDRWETPAEWQARAAGIVAAKAERERWQALKDHLAKCIEADEAVRAGMVRAGEHRLAAPFGGLVSANRSTLAKMRELEGDPGD